MTLIDKLPPKARWLLVAPMVALAPLAASPSLVLLGATSAQAAPAGGKTFLSTGTQAPNGGGAFQGSGDPVRDSCNRTGGTCEYDDFVATCDAAGGGLSTEPGGGIDCDIDQL